MATPWVYPPSTIESPCTGTMRYVVIVKRVNTGFTRTIGSCGGVGYSNYAFLTMNKGNQFLFPFAYPRVGLGFFCDRQHALVIEISLTQLPITLNHIVPNEMVSTEGQHLTHLTRGHCSPVQRPTRLRRIMQQINRISTPECGQGEQVKNKGAPLLLLQGIIEGTMGLHRCYL